MTDFYAVSPSAYSSLSIGQYVNGSIANAVLFTNSSGLLAQSSNFTWSFSAGVYDHYFSRVGHVYEIPGSDVFFKNDNGRNWVQLLAAGDILLHTNTVGEIYASELIADLAQIDGPIIYDGSNFPVIDYTSSLVLKYQSGAEAWNLEAGSMNWTNGMQFADMTYAFFSDPLGAVFLDILQRIFCDEFGNNAIVFTSSGIELYGKLIRYNGAFTAGEGQPWIPLNYDTSLSAAANYNFTTSATAGQYRVTCSVQITSAWTTGTMAATIAWNNGAAKTKVLFTGLTMNVANSEDSGTYSFIVASSTTINISTAFTGATGSGTYKIKTVIEKIGAN